jgi:hypothetical protein
MTKEKKIVVSQPMFFPWVGIFEQLQLADVFVHYDDVQFSKRTFVTRVQIKTHDGPKWLTIPLLHQHQGNLICELDISEERDWRAEHLKFLTHTYRKAAHAEEMLTLVQQIYAKKVQRLVDLTIPAFEQIAEYFALTQGKIWARSSQLGILGSSSQRLLDIVKHFGGTTYITGWGARNYLDHELFEQQGIRVEYINYQKKSYEQLHGAFDPFVSILDLIANVGRDGRANICSQTLYWKEFVTHG